MSIVCSDHLRECGISAVGAGNRIIPVPLPNGENRFTLVADLYPLEVTEGVVPRTTIFPDKVESIGTMEDVRGFAVLYFHSGPDVFLAPYLGVPIDPLRLAPAVAALHWARVYNPILKRGGGGYFLRLWRWFRFQGEH